MAWFASHHRDSIQRRNVWSKPYALQAMCGKAGWRMWQRGLVVCNPWVGVGGGVGRVGACVGSSLVSDVFPPFFPTSLSSNHGASSSAGISNVDLSAASGDALRQHVGNKELPNLQGSTFGTLASQGVFDTLLNMNVIRHAAAAVTSWPDHVLRAGKEDQTVTDVDALFFDGFWGF